MRFPPFNVMLCPIDPEKELMVYAQRFGNTTENPVYTSLFNSEQNDTHTIHIRKGDPNILVGGYIPNERCDYVHSAVQK